MKTIANVYEKLDYLHLDHEIISSSGDVYLPNVKDCKLRIAESMKTNVFLIDWKDKFGLSGDYGDVLNAIDEYIKNDISIKPTGTQEKIAAILDGMKDLLLYKNQKYGDSAINPKKIFYKGDSTNSILIRLDDKLGRVMSNPDEKPRINDVADIIGYCTLLMISMGVTPDDIAKFKD
jgi:hypothetical protein